MVKRMKKQYETWVDSVLNIKDVKVTEEEKIMLFLLMGYPAGRNVCFVM